MGMEILEAERNVAESMLASDLDPKVNMDKKLDESIKFGLVDTPHRANGEANKVNHEDNANLPKNVVDEWPAPKQVHSFYFVKYRSYDDPKLKEKIEKADKDLGNQNKERAKIVEKLKAKRDVRANVISQLKPLTDEDKNFRSILNEKKKDLGPLQDALGQFRDAKNAGVGLCSSEEELNDRIRSLHYRIQHESNTLVEEKQLLKQIKQLEGTREKVISNVALKAQLQEKLGEKGGIQDNLKLKYGDLNEVRKSQQDVWSKIKLLEEELASINNDISSLQQELMSATEKREKAYATLVQLRKSRDEVNAVYFQNRSLLNNVKDLAAKKDILALEGLSHSEVEKFMSQWTGSKAFREDYQKRILASLDARQLSRDGRMRNPDEKPILSEVSAATDSDAVPTIAVKKAKDDPKPSARHDMTTGGKDQEEHTIKSTKEGIVAGALDSKRVDDSDKQQKASTKHDEVDAAKLKEMKREEEIAKAKLALERKKKLAEKAAAKAAIRAQKEAEKKLKEKERRAKKKAGASGPSPDEQTETDSKDAEPEDDNLSPEVAPLEKNKEQKDPVIRHRNKPKTREQIPKMILKRKKAQYNWMWIAPAVVAMLVLVAAAFYFSYGKSLSA